MEMTLSKLRAKPRTKKQAITRLVFLAIKKNKPQDFDAAVVAARQKGLDVSTCRDERGACVINAFARMPYVSDHGGSALLEKLWPFRPAVASVDENGCDALQHAMQKGAEHLAARLAGHCDVERRDMSGRTTLMRAIYAPFPSLAAKLMSVSNLAATDNVGQTALHHAVMAKAPEFVRALLAAGANPWAEDAQGNDALSLAGSMREWESVDCFAHVAPAERLAQILARMIAYDESVRLKKVWENPNEKPVKMPRTRARLEQEQLRAAVQEGAEFAEQNTSFEKGVARAARL